MTKPDLVCLSCHERARRRDRQAETEPPVDEVLVWCEANGFDHLAVTESIGMVAVRSVKKQIDVASGQSSMGPRRG